MLLVHGVNVQPQIRCLLLLFLLAAGSSSSGAGPVHQEIDALILQASGSLPVAPPADDAEFLRRVHLDLGGMIPTTAELKLFLSEKAPDKREKVIDALLNGPGYAKRMADVFHVHLMERRAEHPLWLEWLEKSFAANKPWDQMAREIIRSDFRDEVNRGAAFFMANRLDKYGQNTTDYPGLTRDVGRLFLGMDLQCAECHNHRSISDYTQADFQGLFAAFKNLTLLRADYPGVEEGVLTEKLKFASVFTQREKETAPRIPGLKELEIPKFEKGQEYEVAPDPKAKSPGIPKFSPLSAFANQLSESPTFADNFVNRVWFFLMGRGMVEPLDQMHSGNPASHPELLSLLSREFVRNHYNIKWLLREVALTDAYQRSSRLPEGVEKLPPEKFLLAAQRRLSAEQWMSNFVRATGAELENPEAKKKLREKFLKAMANEPKEPEYEFAPSLKSALFLMNDPEIQKIPSSGNGTLLVRLGRESDNAKAIEELFFSVFSRPPLPEETSELTDYLARNAADRSRALREILWAMLTSTEFAVNH